MSIPLIFLEDFKILFHGNTNGKGNTTNIGKKVTEAGKLEADSWVIRAAITDNDYTQHLEGIQGLGISPINTKNKCVFGVIDVDQYQGDVTRYLSIIRKFELPLLPFYSKSGGLHLYVFFSVETPATDVIDLLHVFRQLLGLSKDTEIFPKQRTITSDGVGNWINLPYFAADDFNNKRKLIAPDNSLVPLDLALDICKDSRKTIEDFNVFIANLPLSDAPPCLQCLYMQGDTLYRNEYMFSLARYYKAKMGDNFEFEVINANQAMQRPLELAELDKSIIRSHKKQEYSYKCGSPPLNVICNKDVCKKRTFGIGCDFISNLSYESFTQYKGDPTWYEWVVNGMTLQFFSETDIISQQKFRELALRELHLLPIRLVDREWSRIVNKALENVIVVEGDKENGMDNGNRFMEFVMEFMTKRVMAESKEQINIDRVYIDADKRAYIFKAQALLDFIIDVKKFRDYNSVMIQAKIRQLGGAPLRYYINKDLRNLRCWYVPLESIQPYTHGSDVRHMAIDFMTKDTGEGKF